jgi:hypothetical protein
MLLISKGCFGAPPDAHLFASESFLSEVASSFVLRRSINGEQGESVDSINTPFQRLRAPYHYLAPRPLVS